MTSGDARFESDRGTPPEGLPDSARAPSLAAEEVVFGRYRILRELGRGGMGVVYLAHDEELGIEVALKLLPELVVQDEEGLAELKREVVRGIALTHPGIVRTYSFARDATMAGLVMEYVDGGTFVQLKRHQPGGCFDVEDLLPWLEHLCPILDFAHFEARVVHRDIKPRNIMFTLAGQLKVADFGISSVLCDTVSRVSVQKHTSGTPAYMSPQQVMGGHPSHLDDIYSLGATIYEMLTGKPPFHRGQVVAQVMDAVAPSMAERRIELGVEGKNPIPQAWEYAVAACLSKEPSGRPQSAGFLLALLKAAGAAEGTAPAEPNGPPPAIPSNRAPPPRDRLPVPMGREIEPETNPYNVLPGSRARTLWWAGGAGLAAAGLLAFAFWPKDPGKGKPVENTEGQPEERLAQGNTGPEPSVGQEAGAKDPGVPMARATARDLEAAKPGDIRTVDLGQGASMAFCGIPAGKFLMGSPESEEGRRSDQTQHEVTLTKGFWLARTEVTQAQWQAVMGRNPSKSIGAVLPVEQVCWTESAEFCRKLTARERSAGTLPEGWEFALPTEAQWEYACRAGSTGPFGGSGKLDEMGWHEGNSSGRSQPVGKKQANAWGLHDMHGNVSEWCADWANKYPPGSATDPTGPASGDFREFRGGSWACAAADCRAAARLCNGQGYHYLTLGFRPALVPSKQASLQHDTPSTGGGTPSTAPPMQWLLVNSAGPASNGFVAYDSDRQVAVMFACGGTGGVSDETWEFEGTSWRKVAVPSPRPRARDAFGKMVYDAFHKKMIMQGGHWWDESDPWTWEYRVTGPGPEDRQWVKLVQADCAYRSGNCMAYDSKRHTLLGFGGAHWQQFHNDTWRFDGSKNTWTKLLNFGPGRWGADMVYDSARDKFVMFGGSGRWWTGGTEQGCGNTCEFDPRTDTWTEVLREGAAGAPASRMAHSMVYDAAAGVTILWGGGRRSDGHAYADTWEWNGTTWKEIPSVAGQPGGGVLWSDSARKRVAWKDAPSVPGEPTGGVMWFDTARQKVMLFSAPNTYICDRPGQDQAGRPNPVGQDPQGAKPNAQGTGGHDPAAAKPGEAEWVVLSGAGPAPAGIVAYDSDRQVAVMFACGGKDNCSDETWEFAGTTWRKVAVVGPKARDASGKMVYDAFHKKMIMQGGWWKDDNDPWTWEYRVTGPGPDDRQWVKLVRADCAYRGGNCLAYDSKRHTLIGFGGNHWQQFPSDTWRFDGSMNTWTKLQDWGPSRFGAGLVYDSGRDKFVMFGGTGRWWSGVTEQGRGNTCEFDPRTDKWTEVLREGAPGAPAPRLSHNMVYDAAAGVTILMGGKRSSDKHTYTDTWEWNGTTWKEIPSVPGQPTGGVMWFDTAQQKVMLFSAPNTYVLNRSPRPPASSLPEGFTLIPGGEFQMGNALSGGSGESSRHELPLRTIQVRSFFMAKHEVTKALWDEVREWGSSHGYTDLPPGGGKASNHPVQSISWDAMVKWCNARSEKEGRIPCYAVSGRVYREGSSLPDCNWSANGYRLPSEAEWEKAARGGLTGKRFPWGDTISHDQANFSNSGGEAYQSGSTGLHPLWSNNNDGNRPYTAPVGSFSPNGYGLYDMAGNVYELCWDWFGAYPETSQADPTGPVSGSTHVVRGGGWFLAAYHCRVARRYGNPWTSTYTDAGFRLARSSVP